MKRSFRKLAAILKLRLRDFIAPVALIGSVLTVEGSASGAGSVLLRDAFKGNAVDPALWYIPTWTSPTDGTYVGRTQFRVTPDSGLPPVADDKILIPIEAYNPRGGSVLAFYGTELLSKREFALRQGLDVIVRARMDTTEHPGLVGGIFLYALKPGSDTLHDEIDFELLTNLPNRVQTNIYGNEELGIGHVKFVPYRSGTMAEFHSYEIEWRKDRVSWLLDGKLIRTTTENIPAGPMRFYLNIWAPDEHWPQAYNAAIQPAASQAANVTLTNLTVSSVEIRSVEPTRTETPKSPSP